MITGLSHQQLTFIPLVGLLSAVISIRNTTRSCRLLKVKASTFVVIFILLTDCSCVM